MKVRWWTGSKNRWSGRICLNRFPVENAPLFLYSLTAFCLSVPVSTQGMSTFTGSVLGWLQIINQIKCCCGVILLMYNPAVPLNVKMALSFFSSMTNWLRDRSDCSCDSQPPRPLKYHDLVVSALRLPVPHCFLPHKVSQLDSTVFSHLVNHGDQFQVILCPHLCVDVGLRSLKFAVSWKDSLKVLEDFKKK